MLKYFFVFTILLILVLLFENKRELSMFQKVHYKVYTEKLKEKSSITFTFLSDLHNKQYGDHNKDLLEAIKDQNPDAIIVGGDFITRSDKTSFDTAFHDYTELTKICPVFYANGNHEQKLKLFPDDYELSYKEMYEFLVSAGIHVLENQTEHFEIKNQTFAFTGLEIPIYGYSYFGKGRCSYQDMVTCIGQPNDNEEFKILLAHNPMYMKTYLKWKPDMILSGHLHGGIVRIPYLGGVIAPDFNPFPKYSGGLYQEEKTTVIVSNGLGTHSVPIRINCPAQLIHITLYH